ncbi:MAG TPA: hypothetical protein VMF50_10370 [Candidatus Binataceae bacterium]|nr:hypothetical protein [Candidatus Binataceae bacterium]
MYKRILGVFVLMIGLTVGGFGIAHAYNHGWGNDAPELDPTTLGSGIAVLAGGVILLNERRRSRK